jgi:hypothetical protein
MTHQIIKTDNYLLVVDDKSEIKDDVWHLDNGVIKKWKGNLHSNRLTSKKIIYHLPLNNAPILEGVPLLPPLEDESNFFAEQETIKNEWNSEKSFKAGYNKAKEKYKYTEEDLRKAFNAGDNYRYYENGGFRSFPSNVLNEDEIIQSLQQPKYPVAFECEMVLHLNETWSTELGGGILSKPKTITNPQGLTQLVGKYIY